MKGVFQNSPVGTGIFLLMAAACARQEAPAPPPQATHAQKEQSLTLVLLYKALGGGAEILQEPQAAENAAALSATR